MKSPPDFVTIFGSRPMGALRVAGFFTLIGVMVPIHLVYRVVKPKDLYRMPQLFHRILLRILKFRVRTFGAITAQPPTLFVSNHSSYLDIPVLAAILPAAFVAKAEVASWPLIGRLAKLQNTLFVERRSGEASKQRGYLREKLAQGVSLLIFPEGTSTDGLHVLPFKSSLFSIVEEAMEDITLTVQPISVTCTGIGGLPITRDYRPLYAWYGDMTFVRHLWSVFKLGGFSVDIIFHPPVTAQSFPDRKALALYCHQEVARGIEQSLRGREIVPPTETLTLLSA